MAQSKAFSNLRFPTHFGLITSRILTFSTDIVELKNGYEQRNASWMDGRHKFSVHLEIRDAREIELLYNFFRIHRGRAIGFRFRDWSDWYAEEQMIGVTSSGSNIFQLVKSYEFQGIRYTRKITLPVLERFCLTVGGQKCDDFELDQQTGILKLKSSVEPNLEVRATFNFDVPVRFEMDELLLKSTEMRQATFEVEMIEVRL